MSIDQNPEAKPSVPTPSAQELSEIDTLDTTVPDPTDFLTDTPTTEERIALQPATKPDVLRTGWRGFLDKPIGKAAAAGAAVVAAGSIVGGVIYGMSNANSAPDPQTTNSTEPNPSNTPDILPSETPTPEATPIAELVIPEELKPIQAETADQFNNESKAVQLKYLSWLVAQATNGQGIQVYAQEFQAKSQQSYDVYPESVSIDNTPQEASTILTYNDRIMWSQPTGLDAQKAMIAVLEGGESSPDYAVLMSRIQPDQPNYIALTARQLAASANAVGSEITSSSDLQTDANGRTYRTTTWTVTQADGNGVSQTLTGNGIQYYYEYVDYNNVKTSTWL